MMHLIGRRFCSVELLIALTFLPLKVRKLKMAEEKEIILEERKC